MFELNQVIAIAAGGAFGSLLRFWMSNGVYAMVGRSFPYGTLVVNVVGCVVMGLLSALVLGRVGGDPVVRAGLLIGLLGGFTTFSTFSMETVTLIEQGSLMKAGGNIIASMALCVGGTWIGLVIGRQL